MEFEHFALLSQKVEPGAWVVFHDDDDLSCYSRFREYNNNIAYIHDQPQARCESPQ